MTVRMRLVVTDDRIEHDSGGKTLADIGDDGQTAVISLNGRVVELDLTLENYRQLCADMAPWLNAGHEPGAAPLAPEEQPPSRRKRRQGQRHEIPGTRDFYRDLRAWAGAEGRPVPTAGRVDGKKNYTYDKILPDYLAHLDKEAAKGSDAARAALGMAVLLGLREPEE